MGVFEILVIIAGVGAGLGAGSFFVFSVMVLPALDRLAPVDAVRAMQQINIVAPRPLFLSVLFGSILPALAVPALVIGRNGLDPVALGASLAALAQLGVLVITVVGNVPLNNKLATAHPENAEREWAEFREPWARWNTLRTLSGTLALMMWFVLLAGPARGPALGGL
ncbi:putative membrane protein [Naumannella cuiyingiana]|uniref:Putative membrane protein n=1 Tax=Naumannella cuiyingiana TaxID=1347891 RepID=A0A7Z0D7B3_9ACTN|nr:putative membrane protein [Naumannella cuiyingiana]